MLPFQQRVVDEKKELDDKLSKLDGFIDSLTSAYRKLPIEEAVRLKKQSNIMQEYSDVLCERIAAFKEQP
jgi:hypothetical protein